MSGPDFNPAPHMAPETEIQPDAPDFIEQPEIATRPPSQERLPTWIYLVCGLALFLAGSSYAGLELGPGYYDEGPGAPPAPTHDDVVTAAPATPMDLGKTLYNGNCANCHQANGNGQPGAYPPMVGSEWVVGNKSTLAAILLDGVSGPLNVKNSAYGANVMPAWANLSDQNLADIMTYIRKQWGNTGDEVKPEDVTAERTKDASRSTPWTQPEMTKMESGGK